MRWPKSGRRASLWLMVCLAGGAGLAGAAEASDLAAPRLPTPPEGWTVTLGGTLAGVPAWPGAKGLDLAVSPRFSLRAPGRPDRFSSFDDGISPALLDLGPLRIGPNVAFVRERRARDHAALAGLRDVPFTVEAGVFAEIVPMEWLRVRAAVRQGIGGHGGLVGEVGADAIWRPDARWTLAVGPRLSLGSARVSNRYFGIDAAESVASGLPAFRARGGITGVGVAGSVTHRFDNGWSVTGFASYERLSGDAARSPLVRQRGSIDQFVVGTSLSYSFRL